MNNKRNSLHLYRKAGQKLILGDPPDHTVIIIGKQDAKYGTKVIIQAPPNIAVDRWEIAIKKGRIKEPT